MENALQGFPSVIDLNVGRWKFTTRLNTLKKYPNSMLAVMFSGRHKLDRDKDGNYFIDRNGKHFCHILDFLRNEQYLPKNNIAEEVLREAEYYGLSDMEDKLKMLPSLFAVYKSSIDNRKAVDKYHKLRDEVLRIAKLNAVKNPTRLFVSKSSVLLFTYNKRTGGRDNYDFRYEKAFFQWQQAIYFMLGPDYKDVIICLEEENYINFDEFVSEFVNLLKHEGYNVSYLKYFEDEVDSRVAIFKASIYCLERIVLNFGWNII